MLIHRLLTIRSFAWATLAFILSALLIVLWLRAHAIPESVSDGTLVACVFVPPAAIAGCVYAFASNIGKDPVAKARDDMLPIQQIQDGKPFVAQVVGLQWLNPLQRQDYPAEWQILWTLGLAKPNATDYYLKTKPEKYSKVGLVGIIANNSLGGVTFPKYFHQYISKLLVHYFDIYYTNRNYFYTVSSDDRKEWRELGGLRVELGIPYRLDAAYAVDELRERFYDLFGIGNPNRKYWTNGNLPTVGVIQGGPNVGFTSLARALDHLKSHPSECVWAMNWDAPGFPANPDPQINENLVQLVLCGPTFKTEREPLAWIGYPARSDVGDFTTRKGQPPRSVQAWNAAIEGALRNAGKADSDIGYLIHDAHHVSDRIGPLAQSLADSLPEFDVLGQGFNTPALLGDMGAGTALTDVALAIGYANHMGKTVLVAGTTDPAAPTALVVVPPAKGRPMDPSKDWFRARGGATAHLPWWGLRHDAPAFQQGYSR